MPGEQPDDENAIERRGRSTDRHWVLSHNPAVAQYFPNCDELLRGVVRDVHKSGASNRCAKSERCRPQHWYVSCQVERICPDEVAVATDAPRIMKKARVEALVHGGPAQ